MQLNRSTSCSTHERCIHELIEAQVEKQPNDVALAVKDSQLSYAELNSRANQMARYLQNLGINPGLPVGIFLDRSLEVITSFLAISKIGGVFVFLDPGLPQERINFILEEMQVSFLITTKELYNLLPKNGAKSIFVDAELQEITQENGENLDCKIAPESLAYILYTSGSTGKPKGVPMNHSSVWHYIQSLQKIFQIHSSDIYLHTASFSFSSSIRQWVLPLSQGAKVLIADSEERKDPLTLFRLIRQQGCTVFDTFQSAIRYGLQALSDIDEKSKKSLLNFELRLIIFSGEALPCQLFNQLRNELKNRPRIVNLYGQTETIGVCAYSIPQDFEKERGYMPVGQPLSHIQDIILVDDHRQPVATGESGELYVAGSSLTRGYFKRNQLNAEKFIYEPSLKTELTSSGKPKVYYQTGDIARYLPDGSLEILGRTDHQLKIRGMRVELEEIESVLESHPTVQETIVAVQEFQPGDHRSAAYIVLHSSANEINQTKLKEALRDFLSRKLPDYMVPSAFVFLATFPLTPNGKIDRRALPAPGQVQSELSEHSMPPDNPIEQELADIWSQLLNITPIGRDDNFFALGGHSLLAARLALQIERKLGKSLPFTVFFQAPTIRELALAVVQEQPQTKLLSLIPLQPNGTRPPLFCVHFILRPLTTLLGDDQPIYSLRYGLATHPSEQIEPPPQRVEELAAHYIQEMRRLKPEGPYYLMGSSFGGKVAFEMAQQLVTQGEEVAFLAVFDTNMWARQPKKRARSPSATRLLTSHFFSLEPLLQNRRKKIQQRVLNRLQFEFISKRRYSPHFFWGREAKLFAPYSPTYYRGNIILFNALDHFEDSRWLPSQWQTVAQSVKVFDIPGDHNGILQDPHVFRLVRYLQLELAASVGPKHNKLV